MDAGARDLGRRVGEVFDGAVELDPSERRAFLDIACRDDPAVRREVESLLAALESAHTEALFPPLTEATQASTLAAGHRIGPYVLVRQVGEGGMGVVFEATRDDIGTTVALKLVRHGRLASPDHVRRFHLERRLLGRLEHPNIARVLDAGVTDTGLPYLVMEYVRGEPIDRYCDGRRLTIDQRLALFRQVCDAVQHAHTQQVVHRDLKPSNIAVTEEGTVKLLDFGIATLLEERDDEGTRFTGSGHLVLTPEYAAPEQVKGGKVTTASDIYALGLLLFELLSGHRPFRRGSRPLPEFLRAVCEDDPEPPSKMVRRTHTATRSDGTTEEVTPDAVSAARRTNPGPLALRIAGDLDTIVAAALRKEPKARYASVGALKEDLDRHRAGRPIRARGTAIGYRAWKFVLRHRVATALGAFAGLGLATGVLDPWVGGSDGARGVTAVQRAGDVRTLVAEIVRFNEAMGDVPGALDARAKLMARALTQLQRMSDGASDDRELQREIADAYFTLGRVQGGPAGANLGDLETAAESFGRALTAAQAVIAADTADGVARRILALAHEQLSDVDAWRGRVDDGAAHARVALAEWQRLAAADPGRVAPLRAVTMSRLKLGDLLGNPNLPNLERRAEAAAQYREALALLGQLPPDSLAEWATQRLLALLHERLGTLLAADGRQRDALPELEAALAIREALVRERPASVDARRDLAVVHQLLCEAQLGAGNSDAALSRCERAASLYTELAAADPRNVQAKRDLALGHLSLHKVLAARGALDRALSALDLSAGELRQFLSVQAGNAFAERDLARVLLQASVVHARLAERLQTAPDARRVHRQQALSSHDEGAKLLAALEARGRQEGRSWSSGEDSLLLERARRVRGEVRPPTG